MLNLSIYVTSVDFIVIHISVLSLQQGNSMKYHLSRKVTPTPSELHCAYWDFQAVQKTYG